MREPTYTRKNVWNHDGGFKDENGNYTDVYWYAIGVREMMERQLDDPTSWWFYAAIHGEYIVDDAGQPPENPAYPYWGKIPPSPTVPITPVPSLSIIDLYWNQCQHAGWFFAPWHRGYLYSLEKILRRIIIEAGGDPKWALPYWNYFGTDQDGIPPAFTARTLPDGTDNPLYVTARYGSINLNRISEDCQNKEEYTGSLESYGGGVTGFSHFDSHTGALESNPHNPVHGQVGGRKNRESGLMSDPGTAALDPIFYMHHCNIDRMWAEWNASGHSNPTDPSWINGPTADGDRKFVMPKPNGEQWVYTPGMVTDISLLDYSYEEINSIAPVLVSNISLRLRNLGVPITNNKLVMPMENKETPELIGASTALINLNALGGNAVLKFDNTGLTKVKNSLFKADITKHPDDVYLQLEGVKGTLDVNSYNVFINDYFVEHLSLFGLRVASTKSKHHAGTGLTFRINITKVIDELHLKDNLETSLHVVIKPEGDNLEGEITIERISIYRVSNK